MQQVIARVELHGGNDQGYEKLHEAMKLYGFSRTILNIDDGKSYDLPSGFYYAEKNEDLGSIRKKVSQIADPLGVKEASVWISDFTDCSWYLYRS